MYEDIKEKLNRIVELSKNIVRENIPNPIGNYHEKCISCLVSQARSMDDEIEGNDIGFNRGDLAMNDAKPILLDMDDFKEWE